MIDNTKPIPAALERIIAKMPELGEALNDSVAVVREAFIKETIEALHMQEQLGRLALIAQQLDLLQIKLDAISPVLDVILAATQPSTTNHKQE